MTAEIVDAKAPRHKWKPSYTKMADTISGCEETWRECSLCAVVKITVHPPMGIPWREWHLGGKQFKMDATPPCLRAEAAAA